MLDRWWTEEPVLRRYFEVVLESGENTVVFHDGAERGGSRRRASERSAELARSGLGIRPRRGSLARPRRPMRPRRRARPTLPGRSRRSRTTGPPAASAATRTSSSPTASPPPSSASRRSCRPRGSPLPSAASISARVWVETPTSRSVPTAARASASGMSPWPTWTPSASHASTRSGRSLRTNSAPCASQARRNGAAARDELVVRISLSRSWTTSTPPRSAASSSAPGSLPCGRASTTR